MGQVAGTEPGQRQLNGPQTSGRDYRDLSAPEHDMTSDLDVAVTMRDGTTLLVDVHRPATPGAYPVLVAASPYPRQIQDLGAPMGFIEAGASDFFVPRGYVHVIANLRGTGGSGGTFGFMDEQERHDCHDLVEWAGTQPWSDGNVGMVGISYFAMSQLEAAVEQPSHLRAIFPVATSPDLYEAAVHHGLFCSGFVTPFLAMVGMTAGHGDSLWRGKLVGVARKVLESPVLHAKFATMNGEASVTAMHELLKLHHDPHPWDDIWRAAAVEHQARDAWWDARNLRPLLHRITVPVYLGCDWQNVPLHLPGTFVAWNELRSCPHVRMTMLGEYGLTWPWESLHVEALAWFDQWLKGRDTGILDGPPIRYRLPEADEWRTSAAWPPPEARHRRLPLSGDGVLGGEAGGERSYMVLGSGLGRAEPSEADPPSTLEWDTAPLEGDLDVVGEIELRLDARATASDTGWIATLQDVAPDGAVVDVTAGWLRASLRAVDQATSRDGAPALPCRTPEAVTPGAVVRYRLPLVANARRFAAGHRIRLHLASDDQDPAQPAIMGFRHAPVGTSSVNTVLASSELLLPVVG